MVNLGRSGFPLEGVRTHVRVGSDQSLVGTWAAKRPSQSIVARLGWGGFASVPHIFIAYIYERHRGRKSRRCKFAVLGKPARPRLPLPASCAKSGPWAIGRAGPATVRALEKPRAVLQ
jgi:hypothetical protein